jgi:hypothetical protein
MQYYSLIILRFASFYHTCSITISVCISAFTVHMARNTQESVYATGSGKNTMMRKDDLGEEYTCKPAPALPGTVY